MPALRTSINQAPSGGTIYPFQSEALSSLLCDFFLSYEDDTCRYDFPFRIDSLRGFGTATVDPGGANPRDLRVVDANGQTVFDSSTATAYRETTWGSNRIVVEWQTANGVCRVVHLLDSVGDFDAEIAPGEDGRLDPRTYQQLPRRVRSFRVGNQTLTGNVRFQQGYNLSLTPAANERVDGGRFSQQIAVDAVPGAGIGRYPGCEDVTPIVRTINRIAGDAGGNFIIEADDCFRAQLPLFVTADELTTERTAEYSADDLTAEEAAHALKLTSDCHPCCECSYYARTAVGLNRQWNRWQDVATSAEAARDLYHANRDRWIAARDAAAVDLIRLSVIGQTKCKAFIGAAVCNFSHCCAGIIEFRFICRLYREGVPVKWPGCTVLEAFISSPCGEIPYSPQVYGDGTIRVMVEQTDPQQTASIRMRVCITKCCEGDTMKVLLTVHNENETVDPVTGAICSSNNAAIDSDIVDIWNASGIPNNGTALQAVIAKSVPMTPEAPTFDCDECAQDPDEPCEPPETILIPPLVTEP